MRTADVDAGLKQYCCCLLYQCLLTDSHQYTQQLVHVDDSSAPMMCTVLDYLLDSDCEWGSVYLSLIVVSVISILVCYSNKI